MARYDDDIYGQFVYSPSKKSAPQARTSGSGRLGVFIVVALSLAAVLIMIFMFYPLNSVEQSKIELDAKTYYAVQLVSTTDATQAAQSSASIKQGKGAGYIKKVGENYLVFASIYSNESEVQTVISKITDYSPQKFILTISAKKVDFLGSDEYILQIQQKIQQIYNLIEGLNKLSNSLDNGELTIDDVKKQATASFNSLNSLYAQLQYLFEGQSSIFYNNINTVVLSTLSDLNEIRSYSGINPLSAELRHCVIKQLFALLDA